MKSIFKIESARQAHTWLLGYAVIRSILDYYWVPEFSSLIYKILVLFNYTVYLYTIYIFIPAMADFILKRVFSAHVDDKAVLRESVLIWIVYPLVTVINLIVKSPPTLTIKWFQLIPTFMVSNNYMPVGLIVVVPVLLVFYTRLILRHSDSSWPKVFLSVLVSHWVVYLLYYQYTLKWFFYLHHLYGPLVAFGFYTLGFLLALAPFANQFKIAFDFHPVNLFQLIKVSIIICIGLMIFGLLQAFVFNPHPPSWGPSYL